MTSSSSEEVVLKALMSCSEDMLCYFIRERLYSLANVVVNFGKLITNPLFTFPLLKLLIEGTTRTESNEDVAS